MGSIPSTRIARPLMHDRATVAEALRLRDEEGLGATEAAARLGVKRGAIRDWYAGKVPRHSRTLTDEVPRSACPKCGGDDHDLSSLAPEYSYLLGLYLGDGCISEGRRGVFRMRVVLDLRYPAIVDECDASIRRLLPANKVNRQERTSNYTDRPEPTCVVVSAYSKSWPCLFPQHGPGKKHERRIWLAGWQQELAVREPESLLRGLIHSDGCRFTNTGRGGWRQPRYAFSNVSTDITSIFCSACDVLGLRWTAAFPKNERAAVSIYGSRKADVACMDEFIGPKR